MEREDSLLVTATLSEVWIIIFPSTRGIVRATLGSLLIISPVKRVE
jgi:hypothetical protein